MALLSRSLILVGLLSLFHAAYSAHEFSALSAKRQSTASLPTDIKAETLISVFLACLGLVLGADDFKPISWSKWAGKIEKEGKINPFQGLEDRVSYVDIRAKRKEFADWVRNQDKQVKS